MTRADVERAREAGTLLLVIGECVPDALACGDDGRVMAGRLGAIIDAGRAVLDDLARTADRLASDGS